MLTREEREELVRRYATTGGAAALAGDFGITESAVRQAARRAGQGSSNHRPVTDRERALALGLAAQGMPRAQIAHSLGRHRWTVWAMLKREAGAS